MDANNATAALQLKSTLILLVSWFEIFALNAPH
jgi:hypothetical protein